MGISELYEQSRRAALVGIVVTLTLGVAKLAGGLLGHSLALLSDAIHSFGDSFAACSVFGALVWAQRPADTEHPYGHARAESVAGSSVALLLVLSGLWIIWEAVRGLGGPGLRPDGYTLAIAAASAMLNEGLFRYSRRIARRAGSRALLAASWDQRLDALGSLAVLAGLALAHWGGPAWYAADQVAALLVALIVLWTGGSLFWGSVQELLDRQADPEMLETVRREASAVAGVKGVDKLWVRKAGLEYLVDIHVEVDPEIPVREGHAIGHAVKDRLLRAIAPVKDVLVHIEPAPDRPATAGNRG
ncbi:MAG: cation diffusion facilitator family transporter [Thermoguttaceae bacterium]